MYYLFNSIFSIDHPLISNVPKSCIREAHTKTIGVMEDPKSFNFSQHNLVVDLNAYSCRYTDILNYGLKNIKQKLRLVRFS